MLNYDNTNNSLTADSLASPLEEAEPREDALDYSDGPHLSGDSSFEAHSDQHADDDDVSIRQKEDTCRWVMIDHFGPQKSEFYAIDSIDAIELFAATPVAF